MTTGERRPTTVELLTAAANWIENDLDERPHTGHEWATSRDLVADLRARAHWLWLV